MGNTSGTYTFSVNRDQLIRQAMLHIRRLDEVEVPTAQDITDIGMMLNMLVKQWMHKGDFAPGLKTWTRRHGHLFLSSTTGQYTLGPDGIGWTNSYVQTSLTASLAIGATVLPLASVANINPGDTIGTTSGAALNWNTVLSVNPILLTVTLTSGLIAGAALDAVVFSYTTPAQQPEVIETVFLRDQYHDDTPMRFMIVEEYDLLSSKTDLTAPSDPTAIYYEFHLVDSLLFTDVSSAQDTTKHICMTYMEAIQDFNNPLDTPEYPQEWFLPLSFGLAKMIAPMYGAQWTPLLQDNFTSALAIAQQKEPMKSVLYFQCGEDDVP